MLERSGRGAGRAQGGGESELLRWGQLRACLGGVHVWKCMTVGWVGHAWMSGCMKVCVKAESA